MSEQLKNHENNTTFEQNPWEKMASEVGDFNDNLQENLEDNEKEINPENLKNPEKIREQLESMGANPEITQNPTFTEQLTGIMREYGLVAGKNIEFFSRESTFPGDSTQFSISSRNYDGIDDYHHDSSLMNILVQPDGNFTIESAAIDRKTATVEADFIHGATKRLGVQDNDTIECNRDTNIAEITTFSAMRDEKGFAMNSRRSYEVQTTPSHIERGLNTPSHYFCSEQLRRRYFDHEGKETERTDMHYEGFSVNQEQDILYPFTSGDTGNRSNKPDHATLNHLRNFDNQSPLSESITYTRNPDNYTLSIRKNYGNGKSVTVESINIDSQGGRTDRHLLVPDNNASDAIEQAFVAKYGENPTKK